MKSFFLLLFLALTSTACARRFVLEQEIRRLEVQNTALAARLDDRQCSIDRTVLEQIEECLYHAEIAYGCEPWCGEDLDEQIESPPD